MSSILIEIQYLPPIPFFALFYQTDTIIIEACENYKKGNYRNRAYLAGPNGVQRLSIPLAKGKNQQLNIREVKIAYEQAWQSQHWGAIQSAYGRAPFFEEYAPYLQPVFNKKTEILFDWNLQLIKLLADLLQINKPIQLSTTFVKNVSTPTVDFRNRIHPKRKLSETFSNFHCSTYPQVFLEKSGFLPNLSILDLLFCTGPEAGLILEKSVTKLIND